MKIRCERCNLPLCSTKQLKKHAVNHKRRKTFNCTNCQKGLVCGDCLKMHERKYETNSERKNSLQKYSTVMQSGCGVNNVFNILESALVGVFQTWRYIFSDEEQKDFFKSLGQL